MRGWWSGPPACAAAAARSKHVLLPAVCAPRSGYATDVIGPALIAGALGAGHRVITAELQLIR